MSAVAYRVANKIPRDCSDIKIFNSSIGDDVYTVYINSQRRVTYADSATEVCLLRHEH